MTQGMIGGCGVRSVAYRVDEIKVNCLEGLGNWSDGEQAEPEGFGRAETGGDGSAELRGIEHDEFALELDGIVGAVRMGLVKEFTSTRKGAQRIQFHGKSA